MEHYHLLLMRGEEQGLRIIDRGAFLGLRGSGRLQAHEDLGDFYSNVSIAGLPDAIYNCFYREPESRARRDASFVVTDASGFDQRRATLGDTYVLREFSGVRIYVPEFHTQTEGEAKEAYELMGLSLEDLFTEEKRGSLQESAIESQERITAFRGEVDELSAEAA